jgi:hypothetical protein
VTVQVKVKVSALLAGNAPTTAPLPDCNALASAAPVAAGQVAPLTALPQLAVVQLNPGVTGSRTAAPFAAAGPPLLSTMV